MDHTNESASPDEKGKVTDLSYLAETVGGNKAAMKDIIRMFFEQISEDLVTLHEAIVQADYQKIRSISHKMKSSVSLMGITVLGPLLEEMESLAGSAVGIEKIREMNEKLRFICKQAVGEIELEKEKYL
jgi:HPt (histidine-containing phosphotransfer) domain-containing protein